MSEEKEEVNVFLNYEKIAWNKDRISELEKKLEVKYENETGHALYHKDKLEPRIEKLEQQVKGWNAMYEIQKTELSELKERDEQLRKIVRKWNQEILDNRRMIHELKEQISKINYTPILERVQNWSEVNDIKEVLRKIIKDNYWELDEGECVDDDGKKLLKMLEGGDSIDWKKKYDDCMESKVSISKTPKYWVDDAFPEVKGGEKPPITDPLAKVMTERWEKEFPKDEKPPIARQTEDVYITTPICQEKEIIVVKEDLEKWKHELIQYISRFYSFRTITLFEICKEINKLLRGEKK